MQALQRVVLAARSSANRLLGRGAVTPRRDADQQEVKRATTELIHDPDLDLWKEVTVANQLAVEILPQLHYRKGQAVLTGHLVEPLRAFVCALEEFIRSGKHQTQRIKVDEDCGTARIAMRREGQFVVRAPSLEQGKDFLQKLASHWPEFKAAISAEPRTGTIVNPKFQGQLRVDVNGSYRAVAKTVFNYLAYRRGVAYARSAAFDEIREYIRGGNLVLPEASEASLAVDTRFVTFAGYDKLNLMATKTHSIVITKLGEHLCGILTLYARHSFIVLLGPAERDVMPLAHEFSIDGSWNRQLTLNDMVARRRGDDDERTRADKG